MVDQAQVEAMANVLKKLEANAGSAAHNIVTESKRKPDLGVAIEAHRTESGVSVSRYDIRTEKKTIGENLKKTFYHVIDNKTDKIIAEDLGLFESAMGIVKHLLYTKKQNLIEKIIQLDAAYVGTMTEVYGLKTRIQRLNEDTVKYDVAIAKYSQSKQSLSKIKMNILKAL